MNPDRSAEFHQTFGREGEFELFSPGRVHLIGEHIDYCGGQVMPMAI
ncbi:MAG: galactokinase family protein, partial [Pseudomonadales bacterium]|nr:galactokinase family protein [Pseudomonadales bacterium]